ncbi:MAG TPA: hypothetical protein VFS54_07860 [Solirubrobacterales bacterium]|nr:hypothetical protein [Solirubrobacterales bacterium]
MTDEELKKRIEVERELSRLAIERADAHVREFRQQAAIHMVTTDRLLQDLEEAVRRR